MTTENATPQISVTPDHAAQVTCPHCGKSFWHKFGDFLKSAGVTVAETGLTILLRNAGPV